jgi:tetratricopeptide (TPR) repeat protein
LVRAVLLLILIRCCCVADCKLPETPAASTAVVESLLEAGHFQRAKALIAAQPTDARSLWQLSRAEAGLGHLDAALKLAEEAVALDDAKSEYHVQLAASNGRLAERASMFKQLGYAKKAKKELDTALELNPQNVDALYGLMMFYHAAPSFVGGSKPKAQDAVDQMTRLNPARGYLAQARLAKERKDPAAEEAFYKKSMEADPGFVEAKTTLAQFYLDRDDVTAAGPPACEALQLDPSRAEAWRLLAEIEARNQCWNELFTLLDRAKIFVPDDAPYLYSAGEALVRKGMHDTWAEQFLRAYLAGPMEDDQYVARAHAYLAEALTHLRRPDEAKAEQSKALELDPSLSKR